MKNEKANRQYSNRQLEHRAIQRFIKLLDVLAVTCIFVLCWSKYYKNYISIEFSDWANWLLILLFLFVYYYLSHLYSGFLLHLSKISELVYAQTLSALITNAIVYIVICLLAQHLPNIFPLFLSLIAEGVVIIIWCYCAHQWYFRSFPPKRTTIIWDVREGLEDLIQSYGMDKHFNIVQTITASECIESNCSLIEKEEVVFLYGVHSHDRNVIMKYCIEHCIVVYVIPRIGDVIMSSAHNMHLFHLPMMLVERCNPTPEYVLLKRLVDIVLSLTALIISFPIMVLVGIAIKSYDGGRVFYKQTRLTKDGQEFDVIKFRSMRMDAEKDGIARLSTGENDPRITPIGRFIRKVRFDELPQLINILKGEMSIVGPRPERPDIAAQYEEEMPEFRLRLQVKAGLTGYAQVYGKYNTTPYDKLLMDLMYISKPSIIEDFKIIFATIKILFISESTEGVEVGQVTATSNRKKQ